MKANNFVITIALWGLCVEFLIFDSLDSSVISIGEFPIQMSIYLLHLLEEDLIPPAFLLFILPYSGW